MDDISHVKKIAISFNLAIFAAVHRYILTVITIRNVQLTFYLTFAKYIYRHVEILQIIMVNVSCSPCARYSLMSA
jgi:hypothetical protein